MQHVLGAGIGSDENVRTQKCHDWENRSDLSPKPVRQVKMHMSGQVAQKAKRTSPLCISHRDG